MVVKLSKFAGGHWFDDPEGHVQGRSQGENSIKAEKGLFHTDPDPTIHFFYQQIRIQTLPLIRIWIFPYKCL